MRRRDFFKGLVAASVASQAAQVGLGQQAAAPAPVPPAIPPPPAAPGPLPWMRGLLETKPLPILPLVADAVGRSDARFFSEPQFAALRRLCELFEPAAAGYPGAIEAGTPEFLDFLIGASPRDRQQMYQSGLDRLEAEARQRFGEAFAQVTEAQADQLIRPWLRTWMSDHPPTEPYERFINLAHADIWQATVNSQAWSEAAQRAGKSTPGIDLYWFPIDPDLRA